MSNTGALICQYQIVGGTSLCSVLFCALISVRTRYVPMYLLYKKHIAFINELWNDKFLLTSKGKIASQTEYLSHLILRGPSATFHSNFFRQPLIINRYYLTIRVLISLQLSLYWLITELSIPNSRFCIVANGSQIMCFEVHVPLSRAPNHTFMGLCLSLGH